MVRDEAFLPKPPAQPETRLANIVNDEFDPHDGPEDLTDISAEQLVLEKIKADLEADYPNDDWSEPTIVVDRRRARRFHADTPFVLGVLLFLVAAMAGASFYVSFSGLFAAASWAVGDNPPLQFAVPIMLDIAIVAFTLSLFVERERGDKVWGTWLAIGAFAAVSATANILHTLVVSTATDNYQLMVGSVISGGAPVLLAFATDKIAIKVFKDSHPVTK